MKIDQSIKTFGAAPVQDERSRQPKAGANGLAAAERSPVQLSPLSARLQAIESGLDDTQVVNAARVAEIKQAISEGRFQVNPDVVADRLIDTVRELIRAHKG